MSQEERMNRRKRKKRIRYALFGFVLVYIFFRSVPSLFAIGTKTELPEKYSVDDKISTEAIIIKDETVYTSDGAGQVKFIAKEGERVPVGAKILELTLLSDTSQLKERLEEIENKIAVLSETGGENSREKDNGNKIKDGIDDVIDEIQASISREKFDIADDLKDKLISYYNKEMEISYDDTLIGYSLEALEKEKQEIEKQISNSIVNYYSKISGIVSYKFDGYEKDYTVANKDLYNYSDFKSIKEQLKSSATGEKVEVRQPIFKIINNFEWYMLIKIDNVDDIEGYKEGDSILLSGKDIIGNLRGHIEKISIEGDKGVILCRFNRNFENYYDKRYIKLDIIKNKYDSFRIKKKCVIEKDGLKGVYIKDISGIIRFRPIEIISEDEDYVYISTGDKNNYIYIEEGDKRLRTVRQFDEIILNPSYVEEGMILE